MLVAVTGGTGFVGRHVIEVLLGRGHRVRALARDPRRGARLPPAAVEVVRGDLRDGAALRTLANGADAVVHLVGIIIERGAATFSVVHLDGTRALLAAARAAGRPRLVHMSAIGARDQPGATPYHRTKGQAEELVRGSGLPHVIFRPSFISGPGNVPIALIAQLHRWLPFVPIFGDGRFPTQPVWVGDVARAFALATEGACPDGVYELGGPTPISYREFVRAIGRACGHPRPLIQVPLAAVRAAARVFDQLGPAAPLTSHQLQMLVEGSATPENALQRVFGIPPLEFEEGLRRYLSGVRERGKGER